MVRLKKLDMVNFGAKGRVTIPQNLRRKFGIEKGMRAIAIAPKGGILLKPINRTFIESLCGKYKDLPLMEALKQIKDEERDL